MDLSSRTSVAGVSSTQRVLGARSVRTAAVSTSEDVDVTCEDNTNSTVVCVRSPPGKNMLMALTGVFSYLDLQVISASIKTAESGEITDEFIVQTSDGGKVPETIHSRLIREIQSVISSSSQSNIPAIYGMAAAAEVKRLRPMSSEIAEGDAEQLELAAAEMAQSAATLVQLERELVSLPSDTESDLRQERLQARMEAAALLERKMAAMEAVLAARRSPADIVSPQPKEEVREVEEPPKVALPDQPPTHISTGPAAGNGHELILQGFNWESCKSDWYKVLKGQVDQIAAAGFTSVWFPPPSDSVSPQGYLPRDLYHLDSAYGSEAQLRECIQAFNSKDIKVCADIVINHRCAHKQDSQGRWNQFGGRLAWDETKVCCNNAEFGGRGHHKTGEDYTAAPNIDHTNDKVQEDIIGWLNHLRKVGFAGWRFDFVKGYHGRFAKMYVDATVPELAFGEFWDTCSYTDCVLNYNQDSHRQRTVDWIDATGGTCAAFDFTTKGILQEACSRSEYWRLVDAQGRPPGLIGMWPSRAITFIENHDTGSTLNHWPFPWNHLHEGYAYILTHPGTPCIFYDHFMQQHGQLGDTIKSLLKMRRDCGINSRSKVVVRSATADCYAATIDDKLAMKIGHGGFSPNRNSNDSDFRWQLSASGPNFAVWLNPKYIKD